MSDSPYNSANASSSEEASCHEDPPQNEEPQFGVVDLVDAFTAMRHEWRGQTKESRELAEKIQAVAGTLQDVEAKLLDGLDDAAANDGAQSLAELIVETDHQLARAVRAIEQAEAQRRNREEEEAHAIEQCCSRFSVPARWLARPLMNLLTEQRRVREQTPANSRLEGLNLVLARLRRSMKDLGIERIETEGQPFDGNTMNSIGTMKSTEHSSGHVAEQLSPCYRWQGKILRFADVRVAT